MTNQHFGFFASTINVSPMVIKTYLYTISDANGCTKISSFTVKVVDVRCKKTKVLVCHNGNTLCINVNQVPVHLAHPGDKLGTCTTRLESPDPNELTLSEADPLFVTISPNPTANNFRIYVESESVEPIMIRITDISGRVYATLTKIPDGSEITAGDNLNDGIYFVEIIQGKNRKIVKLIKMN